MRDLKGIFSALLVSFNEDGTINEKGLRQIIRHNIDKMKVDGICGRFNRRKLYAFNGREKRNLPHCKR